MQLNNSNYIQIENMPLAQLNELNRELEHHFLIEH